MPSTKRDTVDFLLHAKQDVTAAKAFIRLAFQRQGRLPLEVTLDGYRPHIARPRALDEHPKEVDARSDLKDLNN